MSKKIIYIAVLVILIVCGVFILTMQKSSTIKQTTKMEKKPVYPTRLAPNVPQSSLSFSPSTPTIDKNGLVNTEVILDTGENRVTAIKLVMSYDPTVFSIQDIREVDMLAGKKITSKRIDTVSGIIVIAASADHQKSPPLIGKDAIINIVLKPKVATFSQSELTFLSETQITAENIDKNALKNVTNANISDYRTQ